MSASRASAPREARDGKPVGGRPVRLWAASRSSSGRLSFRCPGHSGLPSVRRGGFTLVELLVALALAAMISVSIMFISSQSRQAYQETVKKVDVVGQFRFVFQQLEEDFRNWEPTSDLEFFTDGRGQGARLNYHWDPGEEVPDSADTLGKGVVDGGVPKEYDEFAMLEQAHYISKEPDQFEERAHDCYRIYFRTRIYIDGAVREANVEYALLDPSQMESVGGVQAVPPRPVRVAPQNVADLTLFKIIRYFDMKPELINQIAKTPIVRRVVEVCSKVTDFRIEYLVEGGRVEPGFRTPETEYSSYPEAVLRPEIVPELAVGELRGYRKRFGYGSAKLDVNYPRASVIPGLRADDGLAGVSDYQPMRFGFEGNPAISFAQLVPGDRIFVFSSSDRAVAAGVGGAAADAGASRLKLLNFPSGDYTVKSNINGLMEFEEDVDTTDWGRQRKTNLYYKAAYIPAAVRITLRVVDDDGRNPRTLQREIWLTRRPRRVTPCPCSWTSGTRRWS